MFIRPSLPKSERDRLRALRQHRQSIASSSKQVSSSVVSKPLLANNNVHMVPGTTSSNANLQSADCSVLPRGVPQEEND